MTQTQERIRKVLEYAERVGVDIATAHEYAEPGYDDPGEALIAMGNWNPTSFRYANLRGRTWQQIFRNTGKGFNDEVADIAVVRIGNLLEKLGCELEWEDEWTTCHECGRAVRTQADSYSWTSSCMVVNECELFCHECLLEDSENYVQNLIDNPRIADTFDVDLEYLGFEQYNGEFETGYHPGQDDDPWKVFRRIKTDNNEVVFQVEGCGQFDTTWTAWTREKRECD
jgi:hypothetical protein